MGGGVGQWASDNWVSINASILIFGHVPKVGWAVTVCGELYNKAPPVRSAQQGGRGPGLGGLLAYPWRGRMDGSVVGRLGAVKIDAALGLGGLDGRAAGGADVVAVQAARPTEVHPVREAITGTG